MRPQWFLQLVLHLENLAKIKKFQIMVSFELLCKFYLFCLNFEIPDSNLIRKLVLSFFVNQVLVRFSHLFSVRGKIWQNYNKCFQICLF